MVLAQGASVDEGSLRRHVEAVLDRHTVPREVVVLDALPRNDAGKVLKRELRGLA